MVCRHRPPAPGCHAGPVPCSRRPGSSFQLWPPSVAAEQRRVLDPGVDGVGIVERRARDARPARTARDGACRRTTGGCRGRSAYSNLLPTGSQVLPPSFERWINWPNQLVLCDAYTRSGSAGDPLRWNISQPPKWGPSTFQFLRFPSDVSTKAPLRVPTNTRTPLIPAPFEGSAGPARHYQRSSTYLSNWRAPNLQPQVKCVAGHRRHLRRIRSTAPRPTSNRHGGTRT